jgi:hypothetical protein
MEWQPIETAPKDGRLILARNATGDDWSGTFVAYWSTVKNDWMYSIERVAPELTHWMPLPEPPKTSAA